MYYFRILLLRLFFKDVQIMYNITVNAKDALSPQPLFHVDTRAVLSNVLFEMNNCEAPQGIIQISSK